MGIGVSPTRLVPWPCFPLAAPFDGSFWLTFSRVVYNQGERYFSGVLSLSEGLVHRVLCYHQRGWRVVVGIDLLTEMNRKRNLTLLVVFLLCVF